MECIELLGELSGANYSLLFNFCKTAQDKVDCIKTEIKHRESEKLTF